MSGFYKRLGDSWKDPLSVYRDKVKKWRREDVIKRIERPTRINRARSLGYKAKQGFVVARTRIRKGGRRRHSLKKGRKPTKVGLIHFTTSQKLQAIAEKRCSRRYPNLEVLNSYYVGEDGQYKYYEIILIDPSHPVIFKDRKINTVAKQKRRAFRGLTSAARKSRKK